MKRLLTISTLAAAIFPVVALATPVTGDREVTLSGAGSSDKEFDNTIMAVQGSWGKYLSEQALWGVRQSINVRDNEDESTKFDGSTRLFFDYQFGTGNARPFIGASLGGVYGDNVDDSFMAGPEIGLKYWVQDKTFITAMAEYQFLFKSGSDANDRFDDGLFLYSLGIGYNY